MAIPKITKKTAGLRLSSKSQIAKQSPTQVQHKQPPSSQTDRLSFQPSNQPDPQALPTTRDEPLFMKRDVPPPDPKKSQISYMFSKCEVATPDLGGEHVSHRKYWGLLEGYETKKQHEFMLEECEDAVSDTEADSVCEISLIFFDITASLRPPSDEGRSDKTFANF